MARAKTNKLYRTFVKGLITEASYLTYPEDASTDELNTVLSRKGNRTRRLGIDYEDGYQTHDVDYSPGDAVQEFMWNNVNNDPTTNFLVLQIGYRLHFFVIDDNPVSDNKAAFIISLLDYNTIGATTAQIRILPASFASGAGFLYVCHEYCEPLCVEYNADDNGLTVTSLIIQIRDLDGVPDGLANDAEPTSLSKEHHYNLLNQGWGPPGSSGGGGYYYNPSAGNPTTPSGSTGVSQPREEVGSSGPYLPNTLDNGSVLQ